MSARMLLQLLSRNPRARVLPKIQSRPVVTTSSGGVISEPEKKPGANHVTAYPIVLSDLQFSGNQPHTFTPKELMKIVNVVFA
ncbi:unnamed protein product [Allacma fusca]|uniref:Uncharacterized protein n=1 Tax=Allacma fusca TaxID=39272 RepID=A0A8J2Q6I6_9HEXA|nr:unnamed protein product [Allacma fusca]